MKTLLKKKEQEKQKEESKINDIELQILEAKKNGERTINLLLDRADKLADLEETSKQLSTQSNLFYKQSKKVHRKMCCQQYKVYLIVLFVILILLYIILVASCGFDFNQCLLE